MASEIEQAVEAAFARFAMVYGSGAVERFTRGLDEATLKRAWAHELRGFTCLDVFYAMEHLPHWGIPNLVEFKELCRHRPVAAPMMLKGPKADPDRQAACIAVLRQLADKLRDPSRPTAWQQRLIDRYEADDKTLTHHMRVVARELIEARRTRCPNDNP
jgi:hypothetical protein